MAFKRIDKYILVREVTFLSGSGNLNLCKMAKKEDRSFNIYQSPVLCLKILNLFTNQ